MAASIIPGVSSSAPTTPSVSPRRGIDSSVLAGIIYISRFAVRVLFDMCTSHSFVSKDLVLRFRQSVCYAISSLGVANPIGGEVNLSMLCHDVMISFGDRICK